jgi:hypothetical protein
VAASRSHTKVAWRANFVMLVARSVARDTWPLLCRASAEVGYEVAAPRSFAES